MTDAALLGTAVFVVPADAQENDRPAVYESGTTVPMPSVQPRDFSCGCIHFFKEDTTWRKSKSAI